MMNSRTVFFMTFAVIIGIVVILAMNIASAMGIHKSKYLSPNDVRGIAIEHKGLPYTLNFEQQNAIVDLLNHSVPIGNEIPKAEKSLAQPNFEKIIIYRFHDSDIEIHPIAYTVKKDTGDALIFSAPELYSKGLMQESVPDDFKKFISKTFDP